MDVTSSYDQISKTYKKLDTSEENQTILSNFIKTKLGDCLILNNVYNPLFLTINKYNTREEISSVKNMMDNKLRDLFGTDFRGSKVSYDVSSLKVNISTSFSVEEVIF